MKESPLTEIEDLSALIASLDSYAAIFCTDIEGKFIFVNDSFCFLTEYTKEELIGQSPNLFKSGYHSDEFYKDLWMTLNQGSSWKGNFCNKTKSGKEIWLDTLITPVLKDQKVSKFIGIRFNITENMDNKFAIKAQEELLSAASMFATIGEISGYVSHKMANPITVLSLASNNLVDQLSATDLDRERLQSLAKKVHDATEKLVKMVGVLGTFGKNGAGSPDKLLSVVKIVTDAQQVVEDLMKAQKIEFKIENNLVNPNSVINGDEGQMLQLMIGMLKNSCDAVMIQEVRFINVVISEIDKIVEIRIIDSGAKIPEEISNKFFNAHISTKDGLGSGVGLTSAKRIIEKHQGKIFFDKHYPKTCFVIQVPKA